MNCSPARDLKAPVSYFKDESACYDQPDETPKGDPVKKGRTSKLPDSLVDPIRSDIEGGVSVSALAKKHDVSYQGMRHFLDKHGIGTSDFWTEEKNAALWTMMQEGKTAGQVMEAVGAKSTVVVMRHYAYLKHQKYVAPAVASEVTSDIDAARKETSDTQTDLLELENSRPIKSGNF